MFRPVRHSDDISQQVHIQLTHGISLVPVFDVTAQPASKLAKMICDGIEKAGVFIAQMNAITLSDDVSFHKSPRSGQVLFGIGETTQSLPVVANYYSDVLKSNQLETLPLLVEAELEDRYGPQCFRFTV